MVSKPMSLFRVRLDVGFIHSFPISQAPAPDTNKIPVADAVGVTVVLLTCSYRSREFIRVGYYVNNDYTDQEMRENPPAVPDFNLVSIVCVLFFAISDGHQHHIY